VSSSDSGPSARAVRVSVGGWRLFGCGWALFRKRAATRSRAVERRKERASGGERAREQEKRPREKRERKREKERECVCVCVRACGGGGRTEGESACARARKCPSAASIGTNVLRSPSAHPPPPSPPCLDWQHVHSRRVWRPQPARRVPGLRSAHLQHAWC